MTHLDDEALSALIDGRTDAAAARAHVESCATCSARLMKLSAASAAFRRVGEVALPSGLAARVKVAAAMGNTRRPTSLAWKLAMSVAVFLLMLASAAALKRFVPGLFGEVQGMISGAASSVGSGPKK